MNDRNEFRKGSREAGRKSPFRCCQCGVEVSVPYQSFMAGGDCCGMELIDFCSRDCLEEYRRKTENMGRPIGSASREKEKRSE